MNKEQIIEMCDDIYCGESWQPMIDYITNLQNRITELEGINKQHQELNSELRKENERLKEQYDLVCKISEERKNKWLSLNDENEDLFYITKDYKTRCEKAIDLIKNTYVNCEGVAEDLLVDVLNILEGSDKE